MAIEFHCPNCNRLMRTPDQTAGKKGKCPGCGAITDIPGPDRRAQPGEGATTASGTGKTPAGSGGKPSDKIEFPCSHCGAAVRTAASLAGKKGKCPTCGGIFTIPAAQGSDTKSAEGSRWKGAPQPADKKKPVSRPKADASAAPKPSAGTPRGPTGRAEPKPAPKPGRQATGGTSSGSPATARPSGSIELTCTGCGRLVRTPASAAGKKGRCPSCGTVFQIPVSSSPKPGGAGASKPASRGTPAAMAGLTPLGDDGLTLLDDEDSGLMPLDAAAGLAPLDDAPGLTPLNDDLGLTPLDATAGLTPLDSDPLGDLSAIGDPFAGGAASPFAAGGALAGGGVVNPYQSPAAYAQTSVRKRSRSSGGFGFVEVLSSTWYAFTDNWVTCLLLSLTLMGLYLAFGVVFGVVNFLFALLAGALPPVAAIILGIGLFLTMFVMLVIAGFILQAGLVHLSVRIVKGANHSIGDLFQAGEYAGRLFGAWILQILIGMGLGIAIGIPLGVVMFLVQHPAVIILGQLLSAVVNLVVTFLLLLVPFLIVDKDMGVLDAISESASTMKDKLPVTFALFITTGLGMVLFVLLTCGVGMLLALPFMLLFVATLYVKATGQRTAY